MIDFRLSNARCSILLIVSPSSELLESTWPSSFSTAYNYNQHKMNAINEIIISNILIFEPESISVSFHRFRICPRPLSPKWQDDTP